MTTAISLNGERVEVEEGTTLAALLERLAAPRERVVVEHNGRILRAGDPLEATLVGDGDEVEVITLVGGG